LARSRRFEGLPGKYDAMIAWLLPHYAVKAGWLWPVEIFREEIQA
jgi:hypothetical protein